MDHLVMHRPWGHGDVPGPWAADREAEGWSGLAVGDHWYMEGFGGCMHPFVALASAAAHTTTLGLSTAYANNLVRSPVELAQVALSLQVVSGGRFELGIGTGWASEELLGAGLPFPSPAERVGRLEEAVRIVKGFFAGDVDFTGRYYRVDLPAAGPPVTTPPILSAALAGPVAMRTVGPLVDIIEISTPGFAFRKGRANMRACGATTLDDLQRLVERARTANAGASIGLSLYVATGEGEGVELWRRLFEDGCYKGLAPHLLGAR